MSNVDVPCCLLCRCVQDVTADTDNCGFCNNKCVPGQPQCLNSICAESSVTCGSTRNFQGQEGNYTFSIVIGTAGPTFNFAYDAYSYPDR